MKHLSEEELVEHCLPDPGSGASRNAERHLKDCPECAADRERLAADLKEMQRMDCPELSAEYGQSVWRRVSGRLPTRADLKPQVRTFPWGRGLGYAAACAVLVLAAFQVGRMWEQGHQPRTPVARTPVAPVERHVVVVVLGDHLDRTERLLVELKHADADDAEVVKPLREEARSLLAANHVFREDAEKGDDAALQKALDHLDHLLTAVAYEPGGLNAASVARLQREMKVDGLLFEVRVLRSRTPHEAIMARIAAKGGTA